MHFNDHQSDCTVHDVLFIIDIDASTEWGFKVCCKSIIKILLYTCFLELQKQTHTCPRYYQSVVQSPSSTLKFISKTKEPVEPLRPSMQLVGI